MTVESYTHPTALALAIFLIGLAAESWFSWRFLRGLKMSHADAWGHIGHRTIWTDSDLISAWPTIAYLWQRRYLALSPSDGV
ncbi:MAG: hypothetical protein ACLGG4_08995, partial [Gammaproteobacteria bacterium]